ncbi:unnamed protein product [Menidia menidia]|uniref:(Atlantic silverside) hypothetical protein n=1 Tax=Menidia menidia TaxID=238744 RepID=A0A8S4AT54_9TELE|nr:unnamed protein product [Menidia menidia]
MAGKVSLYWRTIISHDTTGPVEQTAVCGLRNEEVLYDSEDVVYCAYCEAYQQAPGYVNRPAESRDTDGVGFIRYGLAEICGTRVFPCESDDTQLCRLWLRVTRCTLSSRIESYSCKMAGDDKHMFKQFCQEGEPHAGEEQRGRGESSER